MMNFGETIQKARGQYWCDTCFHLICSGEQYRRWLWKASPRHVHVMREHVNCVPEDPQGTFDFASNESEWSKAA